MPVQCSTNWANGYFCCFHIQKGLTYTYFCLLDYSCVYPCLYHAHRPWQKKTHCCRHKCLPLCQRAQHLLWTQKVFLVLFSNVLCPKKMFPSLRSMETQDSFCVPRVCAPKKHHEEWDRNHVSSFAKPLCITTDQTPHLWPVIITRWKSMNAKNNAFLVGFVASEIWKTKIYENCI